MGRIHIFTGNESHPWKTLPYAIQRIRSLRNKSNPPSIDNEATIHVSGEFHYLEKTLELNSKDSYLTIKNYQNEVVTISGGIPLDIDWQSGPGEVLTGHYKGEIESVFLGTHLFKDLNLLTL